MRARSRAAVVVALAVSCSVVAQRAHAERVVVAPSGVAVGHPLKVPASNEPSPAGVKSKAIKVALRAMARGIRSGGRIVSEILSKLDDAAAQAFKQYSHRIAGALDDIARIPDLTVRIVSEKLFYALGQIGIDHGSAKVIVGAVESVLWFLL